MMARQRGAGALISLAAVCLVGCSAGQAAPPRETTEPSPPPSESRAAISVEELGQVLPELAPPPRPELDAIAVAPSAPVAAPRNGYVADPCVPRDLLTPHLAYEEHARTVVDPTYMVPADYRPPDLVSVAQAGFVDEQAAEVRSIVIGDLAALRADAEAAGLPLDALSGYRSYEQQQATFDRWVSVLGYEEAVRRAAAPGHSEHQLGTALDFSSPGWEGRFGDWAIESPSGAWLAEHAWEYGFVMSYPNGGDLATCYGYEPWHYRWIGREAAAAWRESGLTLREFLVGAGP